MDFNVRIEYIRYHCWLISLVAGTYAAFLDMRDTYALPGQPQPFTCRDN
jgi:hypothetical protein